MKSPSITRLCATFRELTKEQAALIKQLARETYDAEALRHTIEEYCPKTDRYARSCHNDPYDSYMWRTTLTLHAINDIVGLYGVESLGEHDRSDGYTPPYEYLNVGDPYVPTLIYSRATNTLGIGCYGCIAERIGERI